MPLAGVGTEWSPEKVRQDSGETWYQIRSPSAFLLDRRRSTGAHGPGPNFSLWVHHPHG